jgi:hypothetical protein
MFHNILLFNWFSLLLSFLLVRTCMKFSGLKCCLFNTALHLYAMGSCLRLSRCCVSPEPTTCIVTVGLLVAVFFIIYRSASLEKVGMAFCALLRTRYDVITMRTKRDATYSLLRGLLLSLGVNKMMTVLLYGQ